MGAAFLKAPPRPVEPTCSKVTYNTEHQARKALRVIRKLAKRYPERQEQAFYRCPICSGFHLTSQKHPGQGVVEPQKRSPAGAGQESGGLRGEASRSAGSVADGSEHA